ncbi:MAG: rod-binding protein [Pseudomonadota bacterium]
MTVPANLTAPGLNVPLSGLPDKAAEIRTTEDDRLMDAARALEAGFIGEMLKASKFGETPSSFGGGEGEEQFASFLRQAVAEEMAAGGGIGLAENLFEALKVRADAG